MVETAHFQRTPYSTRPWDSRGKDCHTAACLLNPPLNAPPLTPRSKFHARHLGATSPFPSLLFDVIPSRSVYRGETLRSVLPSRYFRLREDVATEGHESDVEALDSIEACVQPHGRPLVDLYFRIVHPSFPILHKKVFYEKYARTYREFSPPLLASVYMLALQWWDYSQELSSSQKPDVKNLRRLADESLQAIIAERPKLSTIQACLLLAQTPEDQPYPRLANVVPVAFEMGLHIDCEAWQIPSWEKGLRKRLAWAVFMQDAWGSLITGNPKLIHARDWLVQQVGEADFPEKAEDEDDTEGSAGVELGREIFMQLSEVSQLLANVTDCFKAVSARGDSESNALAAGLLEQLELSRDFLHKWRGRMPPRLQLQNIQSRKLCSTGYLHLALAAVECTLYRAMLRNSLSSQDDGSSHANLLHLRPKALLAVSAGTALLQELRPEHLQSFWYFSSSQSLVVIATLGCELWATAMDNVERDSTIKTLEDFRWALRMNAKSAEFMLPAVAAVNDLMDTLKDAEAAAIATGSPATDTDIACSSEPTPSELPYDLTYSPSLFPGVFDFANSEFVVN